MKAYRKTNSRHRGSFLLPVTVDDDFRRDITSLLQAETWCRDGFSEPYLLAEIYRKYVGSLTTPAKQRKQAAIEKWLQAEERNSRTNQRIYYDSAVICGMSTDQILDIASGIIRKILGRMPPLEVLLDKYGQFTNGASTRVKRWELAAAEKFTGKAHVTHNCLVLGRSIPWPFDMWNPLPTADAVEGSVMFTVPKSTEIDRVACKEPEINMYFQRAIGLHIATRLKTVGINVRDQSNNSSMAREASRTGMYATIDLSSASDTISTMLIRRLLPDEWYNLLDGVRVDKTRITLGNRTFDHELEMFSSMGNGFTFELETLVFYSIVEAVKYLKGIKGRTLVYGDDIITPVTTARILMRVLPWFGFIPNRKKTHISGGFRESCGGHYYRGTDVTPFYVRAPIRTVPDLILILNQYRRWCFQSIGMRAQVYYDLWSKYAKYVSPAFWGGRDYGSSQALVTPHRPRKIITLAKAELKDQYLPDYALGLYLQKLNAAPGRTLDRLESEVCHYSVAYPRSPSQEADLLREISSAKGLGELSTGSIVTRQLKGQYVVRRATYHASWDYWIPDVFHEESGQCA